MNWVVLTQYDHRKNVGIYHGADSGHVLIHCNQEIIKIDFNVIEDKTYNFFIEDELYELQIEKVENGFAYGLQVNQEVQTPASIAQDKAEKEEINYVVYGMIGFLILIIIVSLLFYYLQN